MCAVTSRGKIRLFFISEGREETERSLGRGEGEEEEEEEEDNKRTE